MPQIAFVDSAMTVTHLVRPGLSSGYTFCGDIALGFGATLPACRDTWPQPRAPWCPDCLAVDERDRG